ncbi:hypothetical protein BSKO_05957 [Bryopsis sp. KO-2023]|nr:hypothetical protein BSKO_05957 [Bryopsis sp. KO-2023]
MARDTGSAASEGIHVAVRVRPLVEREERSGAESILFSDEENGYLVLGRDRKFHFNNVFGITASQEEVYQKCASNLLDGCFEGMNASILAYGQTGSGKTHTMGLSGDRAEGIVPYIIRDLFDKIDTQKNKVHLQCQFVDIHNEELKDLLNPDGTAKVTIHETHKGQNILSGTRKVAVSDFSSMMNLLGEGLTSRATSATLMNPASSRSHAIFTIFLKVEVLDDTGVVREFRTAKLHLVDLAGSEGVRTTGAVGSTFRESGHINRGLLSLGNVIAALSDEKRKGHVPYRGSKLTRILKDSLGGNSRTVFLACVTCASTGYDETLGTLNYASRAARIKNKPVVNRTALETANKIRDLTSRLSILNERQYATLGLVVHLESTQKISPEVSASILENLFPGEQIPRAPPNAPETSSSDYKSDGTAAHWEVDEVSDTPSQISSEEALPMEATTPLPDDQSCVSERDKPEPSDHDSLDIDLIEESRRVLKAEATTTDNMLDGPISTCSPPSSPQSDQRKPGLGQFDDGVCNSPRESVKLVPTVGQLDNICALMEVGWRGA